MAFRAYGIIHDTDHDVLVMGTKRDGYLAGFLVLFGGRLEQEEPGKEAFLRELAEESHKRVDCPADDVHRFTVIHVQEPSPASLIIYRCLRPTYTTGEIPHGGEIGSVVAVSVRKLQKELPQDPAGITAELVANALVKLYGGGGDMAGYRSSGIMRALREYLIKYFY
jgi:8-oxo-dGTP pyrophosphatase MutT (NUDIX family)